MNESFDNLDFDPEEFRRLGYKTIDMITEHYAAINDVPVFPSVTAAEVQDTFREALPESGQDPDAILDEWTSKVLPNAVHLGSPRWFGYVNGSGTMMSTLADALAASVNMNLGGYKAAPAGVEIERRAIEWLAELIHYPTDCGGLTTSGGTMANFTALETALRYAAPYDTTEHGFQHPEFNGRFAIYMSDHEGHISIVRCADMLNLGRSAIRLVRSHDDFTMDTEDLARKLDADMAGGIIPVCVVAQVGSINVGAIDPLQDIADICEARNIWFHADGACGAVGAMLPEKSAKYKGLERADSVTLDPHKWLYLPYECGCVLVRDRQKLSRSFNMSAAYLRESFPTEYDGWNYYDQGPQMSRGFKALKLWMSIKQFGAEGYRKLLRQNNRCAEYLHELVTADDDFEVLHQPELFIYSFRYAPMALKTRWQDPEKLNRHLDRINQEVINGIQLSGLAFIMTSNIRGQTIIRLSICSHRTRPEDIKMVFNKLKSIGESLVPNHLEG